MSCDNCNCAKCIEQRKLVEFSKRITACDLRNGVAFSYEYTRDLASDTLILQHKDRYRGTGSD